jgi:hypothetical protein
MQLEELSLVQIKPYWRNPRKNDAAVEKIMQSIQQYGYNQPIVVDKKNVIIAGHTRFKALMKLGKEKVHVLKLDISEEKAKEYRIVDNKSSELAEWDFTQLIPELREIANIDNIRDFFHDLNVDNLIKESVGNIEFKPIELQDIQKHEQNLNDKFTNLTSNVEIRQNNYMTLRCPHCAEEFTIEPNSKEAVKYNL